MAAAVARPGPLRAHPRPPRLCPRAGRRPRPQSGAVSAARASPAPGPAARPGLTVPVCVRSLQGALVSGWAGARRTAAGAARPGAPLLRAGGRHLGEEQRRGRLGVIPEQSRGEGAGRERGWCPDCARSPQGAVGALLLQLLRHIAGLRSLPDAQTERRLPWRSSLPSQPAGQLLWPGEGGGGLPGGTPDETGRELGEADSRSRALGRVSGESLLLNDLVQSHSVCPYLCFLFWILLHELSS